MRHRIIEIHQEMFNHNEHEVSKRWTFEEAVSWGLLCKAGDARALNINPGARNWVTDLVVQTLVGHSTKMGFHTLLSFFCKANS